MLERQEARDFEIAAADIEHRALLEAAQKHRATVLFAPPTLIMALADAQRACGTVEHLGAHRRRQRGHR